MKASKGKGRYQVRFIWKGVEYVRKFHTLTQAYRYDHKLESLGVSTFIETYFDGR